jgi:uncharacterized protein YpuA (DUF1002 family)
MRPISTAVAARPLPRGMGVAALLGLALLLVGAVGLPAAGAAQDTPGKVITLGESLNEDQRKELLDFFQAGPDDKVTTITVQDTVDAMKGIFEYNASQGAFSSTALTCRDLGDGLDVSTRNIIAQPAVSPAMYAMALVTAGIGDATLVVAAPDDAPARGLTALAGVFASWDVAPCESGNTSETRQRLALEELTLTSTIGGLLIDGGDPEGAIRASVVVLETQKTIVIKGLTRRNAIQAALTEQEEAQGIKIPAAERRQLVDLFLRLAKEEIDWSTFALGWNIEYPDDNRIKMTGEGIAIRNAQASATAEAAAELTATAQAAAALTATAEAAAANATATAQAQAQATADAIAAMTATAAAIPTATPVPTATPTPTTVTGKVVDTGGDEVVIQGEEPQAQPVTYQMDPQATVLRDGKPVPFAQVAKGDTVTMVVNGGSKRVTDLTATPAPVPLLERFAFVLYILPLGLVVPTAMWLRSRRPPEPFVVKRVMA